MYSRRTNGKNREIDIYHKGVIVNTAPRSQAESITNTYISFEWKDIMSSQSVFNCPLLVLRQMEDYERTFRLFKELSMFLSFHIM